MIYPIFGKIVFIAMALLAVLKVGSRADAQETGDNAGQLMLLKNGSVLQGFIERTANHYTIQTRPGNRLHLPFEKVEVIADSYSEIYWRRLATIGATDTGEQEALFQWCLRYRLWDEAANQLEIFKAINSDVSILQRLERQLSTALAERDRQQVAAAKTANQAAANSSAVQRTVDTLVEEQTQNSNSPELAHRSSGVSPAGNDSFFENLEPVFRPLPSAFDQTKLDSVASSQATSESADRVVNAQTESQVMQVGFEDVGGDESAAEPLLNLSVRELEQYIKSLPKYSLSHFRSRVEPILISKCSDCHQKGNKTTEMPIMFRSKRMPVTIRMSQRNLVSVLRYVDATNSEASALLKAAVTAHGNQESASLTQDSADYQTLGNWIRHVTTTVNAEASHIPNFDANPIEVDSLENSKEKSAPASSEPQKMLQPMSAKNLPASSELAQVAPIDRRESAPRPIQIHHSPSLRKLEAIPATIGEIPSLAKPAERFVPRDEFDPQIFNRQVGNADLGDAKR